MFDFQVNDDERLDVRTAVFQALGAASMCWIPTPTGEFDSTLAREIGNRLLDVIAEDKH